MGEQAVERAEQGACQRAGSGCSLSSCRQSRPATPALHEATLLASGWLLAPGSPTSMALRALAWPLPTQQTHLWLRPMESRYSRDPFPSQMWIPLSISTRAFVHPLTNHSSSSATPARVGRPGVKCVGLWMGKQRPDLNGHAHPARTRAWL